MTRQLARSSDPDSPTDRPGLEDVCVHYADLGGVCGGGWDIDDDGRLIIVMDETLSDVDAARFLRLALADIREQLSNENGIQD